MACMRRWSSSLTMMLSALVAVDDHAAARGIAGMFAADQVAFDEHLLSRRC